MPTGLLLDTNICIGLLGKGRAARRSRDFYRSLLTEPSVISVITYGEVVEGLLGSWQPERDRDLWERIVARLDVLDVTTDVAEVWALLRKDLRERGLLLPDADLLIASTALAFGLAVVTENAKHFQRIAGLRVITPPLA